MPNASPRRPGPKGTGPARPQKPAPTGRMAALSSAGATLGLFIAALLIALWFVFFAPGPHARQGEATIVSLPSGAGVSAIAAQLKASGVIRSADLFKAAAAITGSDRKLRAGEYEIPSGASLNAVIRQLVSGKVVRHFVTLPEGWSSAQAVDILMAEPLLTGGVTEPPEEGSLWPATYEFARGDTRQSVIARMQTDMTANLDRLWAQRSPNSVARTPREALILASIVEKETGVAAERPRVAAVFSNRLRRGMRLESDPTIIYGITRGRPLGRGIRQSELQRQTDWNTYQIPGLPPTPIANPGKDAIAAVLNPPQTGELFFVADGTGGHAFARTYEDHVANVARWRGLETEAAADAQTATNPSADSAAATSPELPPGVRVPAGAQVIRIPQDGAPLQTANPPVRPPNSAPRSAPAE